MRTVYKILALIIAKKIKYKLDPSMNFFYYNRLTKTKKRIKNMLIIQNILNLKNR